MNVLVLRVNMKLVRSKIPSEQCNSIAQILK